MTNYILRINDITHDNKLCDEYIVVSEIPEDSEYDAVFKIDSSNHWISANTVDDFEMGVYERVNNLSLRHMLTQMVLNTGPSELPKLYSITKEDSHV